MQPPSENKGLIMREPERPIDSPESLLDLRNVCVAADAQLSAEGIDVYDFRDNRKSTRICLNLVAALLRAEASGNLPYTTTLIADYLQDLRDSERDAIFEELRAALEYDDSEY